MQWYIIFAKQTGAMDGFIAKNWGLMLCMAGILGGMFAVLVRMELTDETWHTVRGTPKITGFVGGDQKPPPISEAMNLRSATPMSSTLAVWLRSEK